MTDADREQVRLIHEYLERERPTIQRERRLARWRRATTAYQLRKRLSGQWQKGPRAAAALRRTPAA